MTIISTWEISFQGVKIARDLLKEGKSVEDAICGLINDIELNPDFHNVGYSGWPNEEGDVELDAAIMDGDTLSFGAVASMRNIKTPVSVARLLVGRPYDNFIVGDGALQFALENGFKSEELLTEPAKARWLQKIHDMTDLDKGHDTVGSVIASGGRVVAATSTSGLFMKRKGRVGDSPLVGPGLYADSEIGGATATGVGEDIMKGTLSFQIVNLMKSGMSPSEAAGKAVKELHENLIRKNQKPRDFSVVCVNKDGEWGAASNRDEFPFVVCTGDEVEFYVSKDFGKVYEKRKNQYDV